MGSFQNQFLRRLSRYRRGAGAVGAVLGVAGLVEVAGAINQWTNTDGTGSWADAVNWGNHVVPLAGDAVLFDNTGTGSPISLDGNFKVGTLNFASAGAVTLDANATSEAIRTLTLAGGTNAFGGTEVLALGGGVTGTVTLGQAGGHGALKVVLPVNAVLAVPNAAATLVLGANTSFSGGFSLTKNGAGILVVNGDLSAPTLTQAGGTLVLNAPTRHTGNTNVTGGTLLIGHPRALQYSQVTPAAGLQFAAGLGSATFAGLAGSNGLVLADTAGAPVTLQISPNSLAFTTTYSGALSGSGGLSLLAPGNPLRSSFPFSQTFVLTGANTYTGSTIVSGSLAAPDLFSSSSGANVLRLDFTASAAPASNIISPSSPLVFGGAGLSGGGTLEIKSKGTNAQTFASTTIGEGASVLYLNRATGTTLTTGLGTLTRTGGTLDVTLNGTVTAGGTLVHGILGGWATTGSTWATISNGRLVSFTSDTLASVTIPSNPAANYLAAGGTTSTLSFGANGSTTDLNAFRTQPSNTTTLAAANNAGTLRFGANGGILSPGYSLVVGTAVGNGRLTAGGANNLPGELFIVANQSSSTSQTGTLVQVNSQIVDNGTGAVTLSKSGAGALYLNNSSNSYTGGTVVNQGLVRAGGSLGTLGRNAAGTAGGDVLVKAGGVVNLVGGTWNNRFSISGTGASNYSGYGALWLTGATLTGEIRLVTNASINSTGASSSTVSGLVSGSGALVSGSGSPGQMPTIFTNAANSFTGGIGVTGSMLVFTAPGALSNDTQRNVLMSGGAIALTFPGVQDVLNRRFSTNNSGTLALGPGNSSENIDLTDFPNLLLGSYGDITYTGAYTPSAGVYRLGGGRGTFTFARDLGGASRVVIGESGTTATTYLTGHNTYSGGSTFSGGVTSFASLSDLGTGPLSFGGGTLLFAGGNTADISTRATAFTSTAILDLGANDVSLANAIGGGGTGGLTKLGTGTLTLNAPAAYRGAILITAGTLIANVAGALPTGGNVDLNGPSTTSPSAPSLVLGADQSVGFLSSSGVSGGSWSASQIVLNGHRLTFNAASTHSHFRGVGQISKIGTGNADLYHEITPNGASDFVGDVAVNGGTLNLIYESSSAAANVLPSSNPISLGGGTLSVTNRDADPVTQSFDQVTINPGANRLATILFNSTSTLATGLLRRAVAGGTVDVNVSAGSSVTTKTANTAGTIFGGWATYGGNQFAVSAGNGTTAGTISGLATGSGTFAGGGDVDVTGASNVASIPVNSLRFNNAGAAAINSTAGLRVNSGGLLLTSTQVSNAVSIDQGTITSGNGADLIVIGASGTSLTINAQITGAIGLTKSGAGTLTVTNPSNDFAGPVTVTGGTLQIPVSGVLGNNPIAIHGHGGTTAQLVLASGVVLGNAITIDGPNAEAAQGTITALGPATLNGPINFASEALSAGGGTFAGPLSVNGPISAPVGAVVSSRSGAVVLAGGGNYGAYVVMEGTTTLGAEDGLSKTAVLDLGITQAAVLEMNGHRQTLAGLRTTSFPGTVLNSGAAATLTLDVPAGAALSSSIKLNGNLALVKTGAGTQTLMSSTSNYLGSTTVNDGTLTFSNVTATTVTVNAGGTFAGTGTITALTVSQGGTVAPGSLLHTGDLLLATGAHLALELGTPSLSEMLDVKGSVTLAGDLQLTLFPSFEEVLGSKFFIVLNDGTDPVSGAFSDAAQTVTDSAGHLFAVNYADNGDGGATGNDISLTIVAMPEPGTLGFLCGGGLLLGARRRRR